MKRSDFLKRSLATLGVAAVAPIILSCSKEDEASPDVSDGSETGSCTISPSETAGPFPTNDPSALVREDIRSDREGVEMAINISIINADDNCQALEGAVVDIWHCDAEGNYSEYGGTQMQSTDYGDYHFLRGRQTTNTDGIVAFTSIFPGWYSGRAPHIHVHIYNASGKSLLVTQIAFPKDVCDTVYTTATDYYKKGKQDTLNENDNVFSDSVDDEMATITGDINNGFELSHTIVVNG